jgi:O-antigen ligase
MVMLRVRWSWVIFLGLFAAALLYTILDWNGGILFQGLTSTQSLMGRINLWEQALRSFVNCPLTGYGLGYWLLWPYNQNGSQIGDLHNTFLQAGLQGGIAAFLGLAGLTAGACILIVRGFKRSRSSSPWDEKTAVACSLTTIFVYGIYETVLDAVVSPTNQAFPFPGYHYVVIPYLFILLGVLEGVVRNMDARKTDSDRPPEPFH